MMYWVRLAIEIPPLLPVHRGRVGYTLDDNMDESGWAVVEDDTLTNTTKTNNIPRTRFCLVSFAPPSTKEPDTKLCLVTYK